MTPHKAFLILGALLALSLTAAAPAAASCTPVTTITSTKGTISGTFYATDGTITKVKCDLTVRHETSGSAGFDWDVCPGIDAYGGGVFMNAGESYRVVKDSVPQKSCVISNQYSFDFIRMHFVSVGVIKTSDTGEPTGLLKEKGTFNFTRQDGVFVGKYTATFPEP